MATTKIWSVKGRINSVLSYIENPAKTREYDEHDLMALRDVMDYATDGGKTDAQQYVSGVNCSALTARKQMMRTKKQWRKEDGIVAFHAYQSFAPGEVDAELAHKIGKELAQMLWGDRFEVVVATHLNTKCYHNHFVVNSISFVDGKRYYDNKATYRKIREESDRLCRQYSLSVIMGDKGSPKTRAEWRAEQQGDDTWKTPIRYDIDQAIAQSNSFKTFARALAAKGYSMRYGENIKYMSVRPPGMSRSVLVYRLGDDYSEEAIRSRLSKKRHRPPQQKPKTTTKRIIKVDAGFKLTRITWKGLRAPYYYYMTRIKKAQRHPEKVSFALRDDIRYLELISKQAAFMGKHQLETPEQLVAFMDDTVREIEKLLAARQQLRNEMRRVGNVDRKGEYQQRIADISAQLKPLYQRKKMCGSILLRAEKIQESIRRVREEDIRKYLDRNRTPITRQRKVSR